MGLTWKACQHFLVILLGTVIVGRKENIVGIYRGDKAGDITRIQGIDGRTVQNAFTHFTQQVDECCV